MSYRRKGDLSNRSVPILASRLLVSVATVSISSLSMLLIGLARQKLVCANRQASKSPPAEGSLASAGDLSAHHFPGRSSGHHFLAPASLTSGDALRRITSPDVLSGLTSCRRQPCVPGCFSGHCDLAKPALRPPMLFGALRLTSAVTNFSLAFS